MLSSPPDAPDSAKLLLEHGWGFVGRNSGDVQADNGAGLNQGIIGLVNKGQPRSLDDWGVLRAWAWGDSKILDYLESKSNIKDGELPTKPRRKIPNQTRPRATPPPTGPGRDIATLQQ